MSFFFVWSFTILSIEMIVPTLIRKILFHTQHVIFNNERIYITFRLSYEIAGNNEY
jgi:hypothetical protein